MTKLPLQLKEDTHPLAAIWSRLGISHWVAMPSPQSASSWRKPRDPVCVPRHRSFSTRSDPISAHRASGLGFVAQPSNPMISWWTVANPTCRLRLWATTLHRLMPMTSSCFSCHHVAHAWSRSTTGSIGPSLLVSLLLRGPARLRPFAPALQLHQHESSRSLHLQYSAKSQSTPCCQSLITARSDHPTVLRRSSSQ
jgi:hypothetical protein